MEEKLGIPVYVNNDANCFAAGEKQFGKAKGYSNVAGIVLGTGLGTGLIIKNRLYEGMNCGAGEIANLPYLLHNYEYYCCGQFFKDEYHIHGEQLLQRSRSGDLKAKKIFNEFGFHLGKFLQAVLYAYDPGLIVLGGSVSGSFDYFKESMYNSMNNGFIFPESIKKLKIEISDIKHIALYGAASLCFDHQ